MSASVCSAIRSRPINALRSASTLSGATTRDQASSFPLFRSRPTSCALGAPVVDAEGRHWPSANDLAGPQGMRAALERLHGEPIDHGQRSFSELATQRVDSAPRCASA
jgi:hypothetical protein